MKKQSGIDLSPLISLRIADEVDSQLRQAIDCYVSESIMVARPACGPGVLH
jgi:hypothetical protein